MNGPRLAALPLLLACAPIHPRTPDEIVMRPHGAEFRADGIEVVCQADTWCPPGNDVLHEIRRVETALGLERDAFDGGYLIFTPDEILCGGESDGEPTPGCSAGLLMMVSARAYNWRTVLRHELGHAYRFSRGIPDFRHSDAAFWRRVERGGQASLWSKPSSESTGRLEQ